MQCSDYSILAHHKRLELAVAVAFKGARNDQLQVNKSNNQIVHCF